MLRTGDGDDRPHAEFVVITRGPADAIVVGPETPKDGLLAVERMAGADASRVATFRVGLTAVDGEAEGTYRLRVRPSADSEESATVTVVIRRDR